jgi:hypothetical protein
MIKKLIQTLLLFWVISHISISAQDIDISILSNSTSTEISSYQAYPVISVVADTVGNNIIVNAPDYIIDEIDALIEQLDKPTYENTELKVFFLNNSSPLEISDIIVPLFKLSNVNISNNSEERLLGMEEIVVGIDDRTSAIIIRAPLLIMKQISQLIYDIDSNPKQSQEIAIIKLKGDVSSLQAILPELFGSSITTPNQTSNPLFNRSIFLNGGGSTGIP